jgi:hypothetical protein
MQGIASDVLVPGLGEADQILDCFVDQFDSHTHLLDQAAQLLAGEPEVIEDLIEGMAAWPHRTNAGAG